MTSNKSSHTWSLFLRYKVQTEREYRRAIEDFERLKALRHELPNEPISDAQPEPIETTCDSLPADPIQPQDPVLTPPSAPPGALAQEPGSGPQTGNHTSNDRNGETPPMGAIVRASQLQTTPLRRSLCAPARKTRRRFAYQISKRQCHLMGARSHGVHDAPLSRPDSLSSMGLMSQEAIRVGDAAAGTDDGPRFAGLAGAADSRLLSPAAAFHLRKSGTLGLRFSYGSP